MKRTQNILIIILIFALLVGAVVFFMQEDSAEGPIVDKEDETTTTTSPKEEAPSFSKTGNIMINNPGFEEGIFYLSYSKPGQAGLSKKLVFNEESICVKQEEIKCSEIIPEDKEEWSGKRVKVEGEENEEEITVEKMEILDEEVNTEEARIEKARNWIVNNSPTYNYDGRELQFVEERGLDLVECEDCYELEFEFTSNHGGYGDRTGEPVIQVITPHTIVVLIEEGEVKRVITDNKFNEMTGEMIE